MQADIAFNVTASQEKKKYDTQNVRGGGSREAQAGSDGRLLWVHWGAEEQVRERWEKMV